MIYLKTEEEIELLREADLVVARTLGELAKWVAPGITTRSSTISPTNTFARKVACQDS